MEFRKLRRFKQEATVQECEAVLGAARRKRIGFYGSLERSISLKDMIWKRI